MDLSLPPVRRWHIVISGFLQNEGRPTGMVRLWRWLGQEHSGPESCVELRSWNDNFRDLAELIWRVQPAAPEESGPTVMIYAYSWGAGWGAIELARQLRKRGIPVAAMVLSDPVYRSPWRSLAWLAMVSWSSIRVPANVRRVTWFRQRMNRPAGHRLVAADPAATEIAPPVLAHVTHQYMDDLRSFHLECERVARTTHAPT